ncbi:hypothetical protein ACQKL5_09095 [Peribacillus sp. NPDC097675]|uniref:hypothetical protein n=1 Tax=Peribacillus sp. NPDC097675 TaxID=3390618 RepID=UPI003D02A3EE
MLSALVTGGIAAGAFATESSAANTSNTTFRYDFAGSGTYDYYGILLRICLNNVMEALVIKLL